MPSSNLDRIQQQQLADTDAQLGQAQHDANWANFFVSTPPSEVLRRNLNLTDMVNTAVEQKQRYLAQSDEQQQRLYLNQKRFDAEQELQPLKVQHAQAQIEHEQALTKAAGASDLYKTSRDHQTANDVTGFYNDLRAVKHPPGTPEYRDAFLGVVAAHPLAATTPGVRSDIDNEIKVHKSIEDLQASLPEGYRTGKVEVGPDGQPKITAQPEEPPTDFFKSKDMALSSGGRGAIVRQDTKGRGWYVSKATDAVKELPVGVSEKYAETVNHLARDKELLNVPEDKLPTNETHGVIAARIKGHEAALTHFESKYPELKAASATPATPSAPSGPVKITSADDFHKLPSGTQFIDPNGVHRVKP